MKNILLLIVLFPALIHAQSKPELPTGYLERLTFRLPAGTNPQDSLAFARTLAGLAGQVRSQVQTAADSYTIADTNVLVGLTNARLSAALVLEDYSQIPPLIRAVRNYQPAPVYVLPPGLVQMAYAQTRLNQKDLATSLRQELMTLPADFRNDQISSLKGAYQASTETTFKQRLDRLMSQADKTKGELSFATALTLLDTYFSYQFRRSHRLAVEKVLYELSPARVTEQAVMIPMRDSVRLSGLLFREATRSEKVPAVIIFGPYRDGAEATRGNVFASNGYAMLVVDCRGQVNSGGIFFPFENDARDLYDAIDWASKQPWCDGQVATYGGSYLGFVQWQAIRKGYRHPALKAINPTASVGLGIDFPRYFGVFTSYLLRWSMAVSGKQFNRILFNDTGFWDKKFYQWYQHRLPFARLDSVAGLTNPYFQKWLQHPDLDEYWRHYLPTPEDYAALDIPVLSTTGYYDGDQPGALNYYDQHQRWGNAAGKAKHYLLIGPYDHSGTQWMPPAVHRYGNERIAIEKAAQVPIYRYSLQWFDWVLKGKPKPAFLRGQVNYFVTGTGQWQGASSFQAATRDTLRLYLSPARVANQKRSALFSMSQKPVRSARPLVYRHDIAAVLDSAFVFGETKPGDDTPYLTSPHNLVFESEPITKDIVLTGKMLLHLWLSLNVPDADFLVNVYEVTPNGQSNMLIRSVLRARYRQGDEKPRLMKPGQIEQLTFANHHLYVKQLRRGSRLRVAFASNNSPFWEKNYGFGGVVSQESSPGPRLIEATLYTGSRYPSRLDVPYTELIPAKTAQQAGK